MQEHCCGADKLFNIDEAEKERRRYLKKGPKSSTALLINQMCRSVKINDRLLDIGGGIGILGRELKEYGIRSYTSVDASSGYQKIAAEWLATDPSQNWQSTFIQGDFIDESIQLPAFEHVTLDKVICCYPQMEDLLHAAARKCTGQLGLSFPPSGRLSRLFRSLLNFYLMIKGNPFRTFIHSEKEIHRILKGQGLERSFAGKSFPWKVEIWQRKTVLLK